MIKPLSVLLAQIEKRAANPAALTRTGFDKIDKKYFGFAPGEVWVVGAYTGSGKTMFCLQTALQVAYQGKRVAYFSLEMASGALVARLWGNLSGLHPTRIEYGLLKKEEYQAKLDAKEYLAKLSDYLFFADNAYTVEEIKKTIQELVDLNKKPDFVVVDFIQNISGVGDEYTKLNNAIIELQKHAKELEATFLIASQVSNEEAKTSVNSKIIGFKGSGNIAAAADFGLWLESKTDFARGDNAPQGVDLFFRKVRRGSLSRHRLSISFPSGEVKEIV